MANSLANKFGHVVVSEGSTVDYILHEYSSYEEYRDTQIKYNKKKLREVWADETTLGRVAEVLEKRFPPTHKISGLCHGSRNGFEQGYFNSRDKRYEVTGTDISDTASDFESSVQWDFHDVNPDWVSFFDFVYSNSLDQSWQPKQAVTTWLNQLNDNGVLIIEHTQAHGPEGASQMDPFGVKPTVLPYVLTMWFGAQISISHSVAKKSNWDFDAWLFVISKNVSVVE